MSQQPWHRQPAIIVALLVLFPPVGIALMWLRFPWTKNTKLVIDVSVGRLVHHRHDRWKPEQGRRG